MTGSRAFAREDIAINADDETIRGWLFRPSETRADTPLVVLGGGFSCVREMGLPDFAERFAAHGLACIVFDYRNLGASDGSPRQNSTPGNRSRTCATPSRLRRHYPALTLAALACGAQAIPAATASSSAPPIAGSNAWSRRCQPSAAIGVV